MRFNPPPGWPAPPEGFTPDPGWRPDPSWPSPPPGWQLWVPDGPRSDASSGLTPGYLSDQQAPGPAGYSQPPGWGPPAPPPPTPPGSDGMAIAAFVLGLLGFVGISAILGIVFGIVALNRVRRTFQAGKGLAIAGIVLGGVWVAVASIAIGVVVGTRSPTTPSSAPSVPGSKVVDPFTLKTGDCFDNPTSNLGKVQHVFLVVQTPCNQLHNAQIFAVIGVSGSPSNYPGESKLTSLAQSGCAARAPASLDPAKVTDSMGIRFLFPFEATWLSGVHSVSCIVFSPTPTLRSSVLRHNPAPTGLAMS